MWQMMAAQAAQSAAQALGGPNTSGAPVNPFLDSSGWTVATGGSKASGAVRADSGTGALAGALAADPTMLLLIGGAVVLLLVLKKRKK